MSHASEQWAHLHAASSTPSGTTTAVPDPDATRTINQEVKSLQAAEQTPAQIERSDAKEKKPSMAKDETPLKKKTKKNQSSPSPWQDNFHHLFTPFMNKTNIKKSIRVLDKLDQTGHLTIRDDGTMYFKEKPLGHLVLAFYYLFKTETSRKKIEKQVNHLRKILQQNHISF